MHLFRKTAVKKELSLCLDTYVSLQNNTQVHSMHEAPGFNELIDDF
jgi:hypothetical protein